MISHKNYHIKTTIKGSNTVLNINNNPTKYNLNQLYKLKPLKINNKFKNIIDVYKKIDDICKNDRINKIVSTEVFNIK